MHQKRQKKFQCDICLQVFYEKGNLMKHTEAVHAEGKNHECIKCEKKFKTMDHLKIHMRNSHNGRSFKCETCGKLFKTAYVLRRHNTNIHLIHSSSKFKCD